MMNSQLYTFWQSTSMHYEWNPVVCAYFARQLSDSATLRHVTIFNYQIDVEIVTDAS